MPPVTYVVAGAGSRGTGYASYALHHPGKARVVGVAEPRAFYRERLARDHRIPAAAVFPDWKALTSATHTNLRRAGFMRCAVECRPGGLHE